MAVFFARKFDNNRTKALQVASVEVFILVGIECRRRKHKISKDDIVCMCSIYSKKFQHVPIRMY